MLRMAIVGTRHEDGGVNVVVSGPRIWGMLALPGEIVSCIRSSLTVLASLNVMSDMLEKCLD